MTTVELETTQGLQAAPPRELWCRECGYGVVVRSEPPACPMCRATSWGERPVSTLPEPSP
jgi:rubrerythrin